MTYIPTQAPAHLDLDGLRSWVQDEYLRIARSLTADAGTARSFRSVYDVMDYEAKFDGATNDVEAINTALTTADSAGGGIVVMPAGVGIVGGTPIEIPSNVQLVGAGRGVTTLKLLAAYDGHIIHADGNDNIRLQDFTVDCNFLHDTLGFVAVASLSNGFNVNIENVSVVKFGSAVFTSIATSVTSNTVGTGSKSFTVQTGRTFPVGAKIRAKDSATDNSMRGTVTSYNSGTGALVLNITSVLGSGTFSSWKIGPPLEFGFVFDGVDTGSIRRCSVDMPHPQGSFNEGIGVFSNAAPSINVDVNYNTLTGTGAYLSFANSKFNYNIVTGWMFGGGVTTEQNSLCHNLQIIGNTFADSVGEDENITVITGIENWAANSIVAYNICYNNSGDGIDNGGQGCIVHGNECYDNGTFNPGVSSGISANYGDATYNSSNTIFSSNKAYNNDGLSGPQKYGYTDDPSLSNIVLIGNVFDLNATGPVNIQSITTSYSPPIGRAPLVRGDLTYTFSDESDSSEIFNAAGTVTVTLPPAAVARGRVINLKTIAAFTVVSADANVKPIDTDVAGTAILPATAGAWATLQSDGDVWIVMSRGT